MSPDPSTTTSPSPRGTSAGVEVRGLDHFKVVLIEDEKDLRESLVEFLSNRGYSVTGAEDGDAGLKLVDEYTAVIVTDLRLPGLSGLEVLKQAKQKNPRVAVIITTGFATVDSAVAAMRDGAFHYVTKPINPTVLLKLVEEVVERRRLEGEVDELRRRVNERFGMEQLIGRSRPMNEVFDIVRHVAPTRATVLITGESGTGKELVARAIHQLSPRRDRPFIAFNCAALPANLIESELFGHEKGAFTGAVQRRQGLLGAADGGTLFLDEIAELDISLQAKLLRALEERAYTPLGSTREVKVDVRFLAATNRDLLASVREGKFREDLYYRLKVVHLGLPPLRDRRDDIPLLARHFLELAIREHGLGPLEFDASATRVLFSHDWPGNVRELKNAIESAAVLARGSVITAQNLPGSVPEVAAAPAQAAPAGGPAVGDSLFHVGMKMDELEKGAILATLESTGGNRTKAARVLGISLRTLQRKLKDYQLDGAGESADESSQVDS
jgi:DNA-binding NtrC family response regulator